jgi:hypothetical protein
MKREFCQRFTRLASESLELRCMLSAIGFVGHDMTRLDFASVDSAVFVDLDQDGDLDLVYRGSTSTSFSSDIETSVSWHENTDGQGTFGPQQILVSQTDEAPYQADALGVTDLDGDSDLDLLIASLQDGLFWHENTNGAFEFGPMRSIEPSVHEFDLRDLDGDGHPDLISSIPSDPDGNPTAHQLVWYRNQLSAAAPFSGPQLIGEKSWNDERSFADIDSDGDTDVLVAGSTPRLFVNSGIGDFTAQALPVGQQKILNAADVDLDGDVDLFAASSREDPDEITVQLYLNDQGTWNLRDQVTSDGELRSFSLIDLDSDAIPDVVLGGDVLEAWPSRFAEGAGFGQHEVLLPSGNDILRLASGDINGDNSADLLLSQAPTLLVLSNRGNQVGIQELAPDSIPPDDAAVGDLDGDGDMDLVQVSRFGPAIRLYANVDGQGEFAARDLTPFNTSIKPFSVKLEDVDGDNDLDIAVGAISGLHLLINEDGNATFSQPVEISSSRFVDVLQIIDFDNDGDADILVEANGDLVIYENVDGQGTYPSGTILVERDVRTTFRDAILSDIDGDGSVDLVVTTFRDGLLWYRRVANGEFAVPVVIESMRVGEFQLNDVDDDGDLDILATVRDGEWPTGQIRLYENNANQPTHFDSARTIWSDAGSHATTIHARDLDLDGDTDIVFAQYERGLYWLANEGGVFSSARIISRSAQSMAGPQIDTFDMDGDGDNDILLSSFEAQPLVPIIWFEQRSIGDVNNDGRFSSDDLVLVFQAGEYEDDLPGNSTFDEGDWNQDGDFDTSDLVLAFQAGHYVADATPVASHIAAAIEWLFAHDDDVNRGRKVTA